MCKFVCCFVWTQNLASHIKGRTLAEGAESMVLRKVYGLWMEEVTGDIMRSFMTCTPHEILLGQVKHGR
jgi:hypothetical protein